MTQRPDEVASGYAVGRHAGPRSGGQVDDEPQPPRNHTTDASGVDEGRKLLMRHSVFETACRPQPCVPLLLEDEHSRH